MTQGEMNVDGEEEKRVRNVPGGPKHLGRGKGSGKKVIMISTKTVQGRAVGTIILIGMG